MASLGRPAWSSVDDESLDLILSLLSEDATQITSTAKGKQVEGALSDADLALQLYTDELNRAAVYASDRRMTKSVQDAVQADTNALLESEWQEDVARRDREMVIARCAGRAPTQTEPPANTGLSETELEAWEKLASKYINRSNEDEDEDEDDGSIYDCTPPSESEGQPESSAWAASRGQDNPQLGSCVSCGEKKILVDLARAPCEHDYCGQCLDHLFRSAMLDDSLFPPRCCRLDIPIDTSQLFLTSELIDQFTQKSIEFATPNRTYCHQPTCSAFIPPATIKDGVAECPQCKNKTCEFCKGATHGGDCPSDTGLQQVLEVARGEGWQRCPKCCTMVELTVGCFHITCKCRTQFCYLCAARWKTCTCVQWDETRLLERAQEFRNRFRNPDNDNAQQQANAVGPACPRPPATAQNRIGQIIENLRERHACTHRRWNAVYGSHECDECHDEMPDYIYQCRQCRIRACRKCRFNRL